MDNILIIAVVLFVFYTLSKWIKTILNYSCFPVFSLEQLEFLRKEWKSSSRGHEQSKKNGWH